MNLLLFGATGPTGLQFVTQALARGHAVTAFVRDPRKLTITHERLRVVTGDATRDGPEVDDAMRGQDAVVSTLGRRATFSSDHLIERSMRVIVPAMARAGARRLIVMSSFGVGNTLRDAPLIPRLMYRVLLAGIFRDKQVAQDYVVQSGIDWTFAYPVMLTDGPFTGTYRAGERLDLAGMPKISRADVAHFLLTAAETGAHSRKTVVLSD